MNVPFVIDVKRFYAPGLDAVKCPRCGAMCGKEYLSYPAANVPQDVRFYCGACDDAERPCEFTCTVTVRLSVEIEPKGVT